MAQIGAALSPVWTTNRRNFNASDTYPYKILNFPGFVSERVEDSFYIARG
jgi:hypothetical protein